jgi:predicted phosphoribosyltransferase
MQPRFRNRSEAGAALAERLAAYRGKDAVVLGVPRGGVPVAAEVAEVLDAELDVVVAHKLGAPGRPELAIGAVTANGGLWLNEDYLRDMMVSTDYLRREIAYQRDETRQREARLRAGQAPTSIRGRVVIVVDDGVATGATLVAALRSARSREPQRLVAAAPVASVSALQMLRGEADDVVCVSTPEPFRAVGLHYDEFEQVSDEEVRRLLLGARAPGVRRHLRRSGQSLVNRSG